MASSKVLAATLCLVALPLSGALPRCLTNQVQARPVIVSCDGTGGALNLESNTIKVLVTSSAETLLGNIPRGVNNFQAMLRTSIDADLYLKDARTGEPIYKVDGTMAGQHSGVFDDMSYEAVQTHGMPTVESVKCGNATTRDLQLVLKNRGSSSAVASVTYYYSSWISFAPAGTSCPWKGQPVGCTPYNQVAMEQAALAFSRWFALDYAGCGEAWATVAVNFTKFGPRVPHYNWPLLFKQWPDAEKLAVGNIPDLSEAMYKFVTNGGLEADRTDFHRRDFEWTCNLNSLNEKFIQPCCAKLRTAFTDEEDAWQKLAGIANANGHGRPMQGLWEVCRSLPHAPMGRDVLLRFFNTDPSREMVASDIKFCYPAGPVSVVPTTKPLVDTYAHAGHVPRSDLPGTLGAMLSKIPSVDDGAPAAWEDDGTDGSMFTTTTAPPATQPETTTFATITDAPVAAAVSVAPVAQVAIGTTLAPGIRLNNPAGIGAAVTAGLGSVAAAAGTIASQVVDRGPGEAQARRQDTGGADTPLGSPQAAKSVGVGSVLLLLGVVCGCLCCIGVASGLLYAISRSKPRQLDRMNYLDSDGFYPRECEDQENLLSSSGYNGYQPSGMAPSMVQYY